MELTKQDAVIRLEELIQETDMLTQNIRDILIGDISSITNSLLVVKNLLVKRQEEVLESLVGEYRNTLKNEILSKGE